MPDMTASVAARESSSDAAERVRKAATRKWSARAWWLGLHVYNYGVVVYSSASGSSPLSASDAALLAVAAAISIASYAALQTSSPGYLALLTDEASVDVEAGDMERREEAPLVGDNPRLRGIVDSLPKTDRDANDHDSLHYCSECQLTQPMRAKHCKDCNRCVRQYDHHCDCAGTCVGERNRRKFVLYLCLQSVEAVVLMSYVSAAISLQSSVDEWFRVNAVFLVGCVTLFFVLAISVPLLIYQTFLISTNQTSWEHARRRSITYLRDLPTDRSPFDRGAIANCWLFLSGGDTNRWVYDGATAAASTGRQHTCP